jgi:hypothetical protein
VKGAVNRILNLPLISSLLPPLIIFYNLFTVPFACAADPQWTEREKRWLVSLTYPDYKEEDFGRPLEDTDKELLYRFKPRVIVSPQGLLPVDFYEFYLPRTVVRDFSSGGEVVKKSPTREYLKRIERNKRYYLDYTGPSFPCTDCTDYVATGYGRVYREETTFRTDNGERHRMAIVVLKYNFAFPYSGLPSKLGYMREAFTRIAGDPWRWHELDIHGAVHIVLNERERPILVLLAQHNHFRSYLVGKDIQWPPSSPSSPSSNDGRIPVCFAERSNEPYPCHGGSSPRFYRAVGNPTDMAYVIDGRSRPLVSGEDKVYGPSSGGREIDYELKFLPTRDPLYVSWIPLGDRQKILFFFGDFYRKGPPGIDLNTWPEIKGYGDIMQFWYVRDGNEEDAELMEKSFRSFIDVDFEPVLEKNGSRLYRDMEEGGYVNGR